MTRVEFGFKAPDKWGYAFKVLRKFSREGARVVVALEPDALARFDSALWQCGETEFIAHCRADAAPEVLARSSVVLAAAGAGEWPAGAVLLNLTREVPQGFERFERLIELVSQDEEDTVAGRQRFRHYRDRGYEMKNNDLSAQGAR